MWRLRSSWGSQKLCDTHHWRRMGHLLQASCIKASQSYWSPWWIFCRILHVPEKLEIKSTLAMSTSIPLWEMTCPRAIPWFTMKWHFSQLRTKFFSLHHSNTNVRWCRHSTNEDLKTEKSSINISRWCSTIFEKMRIQLWLLVSCQKMRTWKNESRVCVSFLINNNIEFHDSLLKRNC